MMDESEFESDSEPASDALGPSVDISFFESMRAHGTLEADTPHEHEQSATDALMNRAQLNGARNALLIASLIADNAGETALAERYHEFARDLRGEWLTAHRLLLTKRDSDPNPTVVGYAADEERSLAFDAFVNGELSEQEARVVFGDDWERAKRLQTRAADAPAERSG